MSTRVEELLDICLKRIREGVPLDEVLMEYPEHREELKELLAVAKEIENVPLPEVRDEAVASCLVKVDKALQLRKKQVWRRKFPRLQRPRLFYFPLPVWAKVLAFILIVILISWVIINLSADSLPGNLFYPIKLSTEKVKLFLTINPAAKIKLRFAFSEERMQELVRCLDEKGELNIQVLKAMLDETALALEEIIRLPRDQGIGYCMKLGHLCAYEKDVLESLKSRTTSLFQRENLDKAIQICQYRAEWMGKIVRNEMPIAKWGSSGDWQ